MTQQDGKQSSKEELISKMRIKVDKYENLRLRNVVKNTTEVFKKSPLIKHTTVVDIKIPELELDN